jgi:predicted RNase H-like nuclease
MGKHKSFIVAGVDGCKGGWLVAIVNVKARGCSYEPKQIFVAKDFSAVLSATGDCEVICVDIPIGLSNGFESRTCDIEARRILGWQRGSSVFEAPIRPCLAYYEQYRVANEVSRRLGGKGLSKQSFAILEKIRQVDRVMRPVLQKRIREIHPEVCFWALNHGHPMQYKKSRVVGREERMRVLSDIFPNVEAIRKPEGTAADDVLDALVAAWTAVQVVQGKVRTLPERPETDSNGLRMEIVYPVADC